MDKKKYFSIISKVENILRERRLQEVASTDIADLRRDMDEYVCRVLVIGGFSAGKSAFLNRLLERDLLQEGQIPETAIATEITYDTEEYIEAVDDNGRIDRFSLEDAGSIDPDKWMYLVYHVNVPYLRENPEIVLVDMPGLDSNLERHNKAISQYIGRASAYILFVSCEDGTVRASVKDFLQEVGPYDRGLCCFVSKTDLRPESDVQGVVKAVEQAVQYTYGDDVHVVPISSVSDDDFNRKVDTALHTFDPEALFYQRFGPSLLSVLDSAVVALSNSEKALTLDTAEIDQRIRESQKNYDSLVRQLEDEKRRLIQRNKSEVTPAILRDIENAFRAQADKLADALMVSPQAFSSAASAVIRQALQEADYYVKSSFEDVMERLDLSFLADTDVLLSESIMDDVGILTDGVIDTEKAARGRRIYEVVTSILAIMTDIINPLLELAIIVFPSIVSMFEGKQQEKKKEQLTQQIQNSIVPQIVAQLRPDIERIMDDALDNMLGEVEKRVSQLLEAEEAALKQAKSEKKQKEDDICRTRQEIEDDIGQVNDLRTQVRDAMQVQ